VQLYKQTVYRLQCAVKGYTSHSCVISLMRKKYKHTGHIHIFMLVLLKEMPILIQVQ